MLEFQGEKAPIILGLIALGGALGALARFGLSYFVQSFHGTNLPLGTLVVNVLGSFLLGIVGAFVMAHAAEQHLFLRAAVGVGFLGSFTTFSTFELENHTLLSDGQWLAASAYAGASVFVGLLAVHLGILVGRMLLP